jgi:hypothetical protein
MMDILWRLGLALLVALLGAALLVTVALTGQAYGQTAADRRAVDRAGADYVRESLDKVIVVDPDGRAQSLPAPRGSGTRYFFRDRDEDADCARSSRKRCSEYQHERSK